MNKYERACAISEEITEVLASPKPDWQRLYELSEELHDISDEQR